MPPREAVLAALANYAPASPELVERRQLTARREVRARYNLALLNPGRKAELLEDLIKRTGVPVVEVEIHRIDLLRDAAELTIFYERPRQ
jgi:hypothetical protein